jgi:TonB family protein
MRHEVIAAVLLFAISSCEKKATQSPDGVSMSASAGGNSASATVPTSGSNTTPSNTTPSGATPSGATPSGTTPSGTGTTTTPPPEKTGTPAVVQGDAEVKGELDKDKLKSAVVAVDSQMLDCYKSALERKPGWTGTVKLRFIVSGKGKVLSADLAEALPDNVLAQCVLTAVKGAKLPKPSNGKDVIFTLPLSLELQ